MEVEAGSGRPYRRFAAPGCCSAHKATEVTVPAYVLVSTELLDASLPAHDGEALRRRCSMLPTSVSGPPVSLIKPGQDATPQMGWQHGSLGRAPPKAYRWIGEQVDRRPGSGERWGWALYN